MARLKGKIWMTTSFNRSWTVKIIQFYFNFKLHGRKQEVNSIRFWFVWFQSKKKTHSRNQTNSISKPSQQRSKLIPGMAPFLSPPLRYTQSVMNIEIESHSFKHTSTSGSVGVVHGRRVWQTAPRMFHTAGSWSFSWMKIQFSSFSLCVFFQSTVRK